MVVWLLLAAQAIDWLADHLTSPRGARGGGGGGGKGPSLLLVTHDRYFLERTCGEILELDGAAVHAYRTDGSYEARAWRWWWGSPPTPVSECVAPRSDSRRAVCASARARWLVLPHACRATTFRLSTGGVINKRHGARRAQTFLARRAARIANDDADMSRETERLKKEAAWDAKSPRARQAKPKSRGRV